MLQKLVIFLIFIVFYLIVGLGRYKNDNGEKGKYGPGKRHVAVVGPPKDLMTFSWPKETERCGHFLKATQLSWSPYFPNIKPLYHPSHPDPAPTPEFLNSTFMEKKEKKKTIRFKSFPR